VLLGVCARGCIKHGKGESLRRGVTKRLPYYNQKNSVNEEGSQRAAVAKP